MRSRWALSRQAVATRWADAVHHGVVGAFVIEREVHLVAPESGNPQSLSALGTGIRSSQLTLTRERKPIRRRDQCGAGHLATAWLTLGLSSNHRSASAASLLASRRAVRSTGLAATA